MKVFVFDLLAYGEQLEHLKIGLENFDLGLAPLGIGNGVGGLIYGSIILGEILEDKTQSMPIRHERPIFRQQINVNTVHATHTPVAAGHDQFPLPLEASIITGYNHAFDERAREFCRLKSASRRDARIE